MYHFTVPGSCRSQHDISTPFGNLYAEAVPVPVKEMTLEMSLAPGPAGFWSVLPPPSRWGINWESCNWHRGKLHKKPSLHFGGFTGWRIIFHLTTSVGTAKGQREGSSLQDGTNGKAQDPTCHHFYTCTNRYGNLIMLGTSGFLRGEECSWTQLLSEASLTEQPLELPNQLCPVKPASCLTTDFIAFPMCLNDFPSNSCVKSIQWGMYQFNSYKQPFMCYNFQPSQSIQL